MNDNIKTFKKWIEESSNIVFFGGAGVSTESGIPDFRSAGGVYTQKCKYSPEEMMSGEFLRDKPEEFYKFFWDNFLWDYAKPNITHIKLAELEAMGKLKAIITQNGDGLHQAAGSKNVIELHGTNKRCYCSRCRRIYPPEAIRQKGKLPRCSECNGIIRPDVVLFGEDLTTSDVLDAAKYIREANMLIVGGTSLAVYPAAGLINYYRGDRLVVINRGSTDQDYQADLIIRDSIGEVFSQI